MWGKRHKTETKRLFQGTLPYTRQDIAQQIAEIFRDSWSCSSDGLNLSSKVLNCINSKHHNPLLPFAFLYLPEHVTTPEAEMSNAYNFQQTWLLDISLQEYSPKFFLCYAYIYSLLLTTSSLHARQCWWASTLKCEHGPNSQVQSHQEIYYFFMLPNISCPTVVLNLVWLWIYVNIIITYWVQI